jgi:hypothetical protein
LSQGACQQVTSGKLQAEFCYWLRFIGCDWTLMNSIPWARGLEQSKKWRVRFNFGTRESRYRAKFEILNDDPKNERSVSLEMRDEPLEQLKGHT